MRFQQYLTEGNLPGYIDTLQMVYDNCMPFIKDLVKGGFSYYNSNDNLLMSGRNQKTPQISKSVRQNRRPRDTDPKVHKILDDAFNKEFKIKARSSTIFCSGDKSAASSYGVIYLIFPIGKYEIIWSSEFRDLYNASNQEFYRPMKQMELGEVKAYRKYLDDKKNRDIEYKKLKVIYDKEMLKVADNYIKHYKKGDIVNAIRSNNEIMLYTKKYIGLRLYDYDYLMKSYIDKMGTKYPNEKNVEKWFDTCGTPDMSWDDLGIK